MLWWFNVYAPHWPLSGAVQQDIRPMLLARAGDADLEAAVLRDVASYGRQIGALTDLLLAVADHLPEGSLPPEGTKAVHQLRGWREQVRAKQVLRLPA